MRGLVWSLTAATALALVASPLSAQDASDTEAPAATIQPLALEFSAEGLSGPGAAALRSEIEGAQFIAIGEDHGFADPPALLAAFAAEGKSHGFDTYAIEVGPWSTAWIRERLTTGGVDGLAKDLEGRPLSLPFLSLREEAEAAMGFLEDGRLWGIDQEFIGSSMIHLDWFAERAGEGAAGDELRAWAEADREAFAAGQQQTVFMVTAGPDKWARLREIFAGDSEALKLVDALEQSQSIYLANFTGRGFDNNTDRVTMIRDYFMDQYLAAKAERGVAPRVLFKMGATHIGAGTSPMKTFDIGSLIEGIAAGEGRDVLRIAYLPMGGEQIGIRPSPDGAFSVRPAKPNEKLLTPLKEAGVDLAAIGEEGHYVIALEPVRRALQNGGLNDADWMARYVLLGFDYMVTTKAGKPGTPLAER